MRVQKKIAAVLEKPLRGVHRSEINQVRTILTCEIEHHDSIQDRIEELLVEDETALKLELDERVAAKTSTYSSTLKSTNCKRN